MDKARFVTIFPTFESLDVVRQTLPTVIEETRRADARLIVHDSSVEQRDDKRSYLTEVCRPPSTFLMLTDQLSMAAARNACTRLAIELYCPDYICMLEDDHGFRPGFIDDAINAMERWYGRRAPNGLRFGLFTGSSDWPTTKHALAEVEGGHGYPVDDESPLSKGGCHNGCRIAPTHHWQNVLGGYDTDEYPISRFQTGSMIYRNYYRGFTTMTIAGGGVFMFEREGHGVTSTQNKRWDDHFCASDPRARYRPTPDLAGAADAHDGSRRIANDASRDETWAPFPIAKKPKR